MVKTIPEDTIRRIKNTANIVDVISEYVVLKKAGRDYKGLCPFHSEKTPSFTVSPEKQIFYCFGCHTGGNLFSFVMQHEGLSFPDAVRAVASRYSIEVPTSHLTPAQRVQLSEKDKLYRVNQESMTFFHQALKDPQSGQRAMGYLVGRGMTKKIIDGHQLGYSPNRWDGLLRYLENKRIEPSLIEKAGLVIPRKDGNGHYDRFRDRVMFPIFNLSQQVIGFGGRVMGDDLPKYLNSPETLIFNKGRGLYGIHKANRAARSTGRIFIVEGYFDVLAMHLYGIENCVATLGTALTPEHVQLLKGMVGQSGQAYLVFDSDQAGIRAAKRSVAIFEQGHLNARVLVLPTGHDPDTYLREFGPDDFYKAADKSLDMISFIIDTAIGTYGLSLEGKVNVVDEVQPTLSAVEDSVARSLYIKELAERLDIDEMAIVGKFRHFAAKQPGYRSGTSSPKQTVFVADNVRLEQQIVAMMLCYPKMIPEIVGRNFLDYFEDQRLKQIAQLFLQFPVSEDGNAADLVSMIDDPEYRSLMARLAMQECHWDQQGCERVLAQFEARFHRKSRKDLQRRIEEAEKNNDMELLSRLLHEKQQQAGKGLTNL